jgi:membrane protein YdbS with pleckstrin-like domain
MFCKRCGQALSAGSRFCNSCGAAVSDSGDAVAGPGLAGNRYSVPLSPQPAPPMPGSAAGLYPSGYGPPDVGEDQVVFTVRPSMIFVWIWYLLAALVVIAASAVMGMLNNTSAKIGVEPAVIVILIVAAIAFSAPIYKHIVRRREVFTLTNHKLEMRYGLISRTVRNIPLRNIQDVTVMAKAFQRLVGIGSIVIDSASESGKIWLAQVPHPDRYANMILAEMRRRY